MLKTILVHVDGGPCQESRLRAAALLAGVHGAEPRVGEDADRDPRRARPRARAAPHCPLKPLSRQLRP